MGPSPTCHPPEGEECEASVQHRLPLSAEPAVRYCLRQLRPSPMWGSCFVGARAVGPWVGEQKSLGKTPLGGSPSPQMTYLPTSTLPIPNCANSVLYVDYTEMPNFWGYNFALVVTSGLTRFTRVFPCTKHITGEETIKILLE